jgi:hypothetical protein
MATEVAESAACLTGDDGWISIWARFEIALWTRRGGDPRAAIALWQNLVSDQVATGGSELPRLPRQYRQHGE